MHGELLASCKQEICFFFGQDGPSPNLTKLVRRFSSGDFILVGHAADQTYGSRNMRGRKLPAVCEQWILARALGRKVVGPEVDADNYAPASPLPRNKVDATTNAKNKRGDTDDYCAIPEYRRTFAVPAHSVPDKACTKYDVALKRILTRPGSVLLAALTGCSSLRWLNVEAPLVRNLRVDLLGESPDGELVHIELQSRNEKNFPLRMGEYSFVVALRHGRLPRQVALYVGAEPLRMKDEIGGPSWAFRFHLVDIRDLDGELLLASNNPGDNVIAILTRLGGEPDAVRRVLKRIADGPSDERDEAMAELSILAGLRSLGDEVTREAGKMPIQEDIIDHDYFGPLIRQRMMSMLEKQIEKKFGGIPPPIRTRLDALKPAQIEATGLRLLDAQRIEDLFAR